MRNRLKRLREAASRAIEAAKTGPQDALKNVTEGMLKNATASGLPPEVATAGSAAAAGLWTRVSPDDPLAQARLVEALVRDGRAAEALSTVTLAEDETSSSGLLAQAWLARADVIEGKTEASLQKLERIAALLPTSESAMSSQTRGAAGLAALDANAIDLATRILGRDGADPLHKVGLARLALIDGQLEEAERLLLPLLATGLEEATTWRAIGLAVGGQPRQATEMLDSLKSHGPERQWVEVTLGWLQLLDGKLEAAATIRRCLERPHRLPAASFLAGIIAEREEDSETAQAAFLDAAKSTTGWSEPWLGVLRTAMATGDYTGARDAAKRAGASQDYRVLTGLAVGLSGDAAGAEEHWRSDSRHCRDREMLKEVAMLRSAVAWRLSAEGKSQAAADAWQMVGSRASHAGSSRVTLARWALDAARRCLEETQPPYYVVESALNAAATLRPESEDLVVAHCAASFLARGPATARDALESALARGATDERITGLLGLIDAATKGAPVPVQLIRRSTTATEAAAFARDGDAKSCLAAISKASEEDPNAALKAVLRGSKALVELAQLGEYLQLGEMDKAAEVLGDALEHIPAGLARDHVLHDLAAVCTIAARRADEHNRMTGEPPSQQAMVWWQEALGYWAALASASAYWADLAKRVLEYDDPRLTPRDVDALRASIHDVTADLPATQARAALAAGHRKRARAFVALIIGAPFSENARQEALKTALSPLTEEAHRVADGAKKTALECPENELSASFKQIRGRIEGLQEELAEAAPDTIGPAIDIRDELALCLVSLFENLHDRSRDFKGAFDALSYASELAASETLRAELASKLARMREKS